MSSSEPIRVLIVDDEPAIREAYELLLESAPAARSDEVATLRDTLFPSGGTGSVPAWRFEVATAANAHDGVDAVGEALARGARFDVVFLDMRMPPGPDGAWAAEAIRRLDPELDIVIATAYSDVDPAELSQRIPPAERLFYLQKPFHSHEVRQLAVAIGGKSRAEAELRYTAYTDLLTGLANRARLEELLSQQLGTHDALALLWTDLNGFKRVNDTLGHGAGDAVLREAATRIRGGLEQVRIRDDLVIARMGGADFLVLLPETQGREASRLARAMNGALSEPFHVGEHQLHLSASTGIALAPGHGRNPEDLMRNADLAMHFAREGCPEGVRLYEDNMTAQALRSLTLEQQLRGAIERGELHLEFQPQLGLRAGRVTGMEALLRWQSPSLGRVPPLDFIELAEQTGLIEPIGRWVLEQACEEARGWLEAGLDFGRIAVNVSAVQLASETFASHVVSVLESSGIPPQVLELEVTETALIATPDLASSRLARLTGLGVQVAIDDFGVGHSNIEQLKRLRADRVKIDRCFVSDLVESQRDRAITTGVVAIARDMGLSVTAEGVEDEEQLEILAASGCDEVQGYFISRPLTSRQAREYLHALARGSRRPSP